MEKTKVLLVGSGAREHAIADALIAGGAELYAYMQLLNPGIKKIAKRFAVGKADDVAAAVKFAKENSAEMAVIGPEAPLAAGMVDELEKAGVKCVGPTKKLAQLETSKGFTRQLLKKHGIEGNPEFRAFNSGNSIEIEGYLKQLGGYVVKPDGLTGGKGVKVSGEHLQSVEEALNYCNELLKSHTAVVVEEKLEGEEFSLQTLTDGNGGFLHFPVVQDHKRAFENDIGPNTGGMGSYSDANFLLPFLTAEDVDAARKITEKVAAAIRKELGTAYKGIMYGGFMKTGAGIKLLEYNARFGDPEAMNIMPLLKTNFVDICKAIVEGKLSKMKVEFENKATVCKYVVPEGYPDSPVAGKIEVPNCEKNFIKALVYYREVEEKSDGIYTTKSRAVAFVGIADTITAAERIAEEAASMVKGRIFHRKDIGTYQLVQKKVEHMKKLMEGNAKPLYKPKNEPMRIAAFMSGTGSNLRNILGAQQHDLFTETKSSMTTGPIASAMWKGQSKNGGLFKVVMIFTDTADETVCNAKKIAGEYRIAYYCNDMKEYYRSRGHSDRKDMKVRQEYDSETAKLLRMHKVDIVALCGYMSIITKPVIGSFLTVNVHPADLRIKDGSGRRKYAGCLGAECVKAAILNGDKEVRSTTHIVSEGVDEGQILLVSKPVKLPKGISNSEMDKAAHELQEKLKGQGDWKIYPETLKTLAEGRFAINDTGIVCLDGKPIPDGYVVG